MLSRSRGSELALRKEHRQHRDNKGAVECLQIMDDVWGSYDNDLIAEGVALHPQNLPVCPRDPDILKELQKCGREPNAGGRTTFWRSV